MRGFNRAIIAGNLTQDPEVRYTVNKKAFARFGVAVSNSFKNANGEQQETTDYINVVVWGSMAENCGKYLKKGRPVLVEGRIQTSSYEAKDGSGKRYSTEINALNVIFLGSGQGSSSGSGSGYQSSESYSQMPSADGDSDFGRSIGESNFGGDMPQEFSNGSNDESDIPF